MPERVPKSVGRFLLLLLLKSVLGLHYVRLQIKGLLFINCLWV